MSTESHIVGETMALADFSCDKALHLTADHHEHLILSEISKSIHLDCEGDSLLQGPGYFDFVHRGLNDIERKFQTLRRLKFFLQDGVFRPSLFKPTPHFEKLSNNLIALDGWQNSDQQREIAIRIFGIKTVNEQWGQGSDYLRARVHRHIKRGIHMMNGGYLKLLNSR